MRKGKLLGGILACVLVSGFVFFSYYGFYTIQPLGVIPDGMTLIVRRYDGEPIFKFSRRCMSKAFWRRITHGACSSFKGSVNQKTNRKAPLY